MRYSRLMGLLFLGFSVGAFGATEANRPESPQKKKIVFLGDSLTDGYGIAKADAFPALIQKKLESEGRTVEVVNAGISGSTTASGVARLKWLLKSAPDIVVIALGGNDGLRGFPLETTRKNLAEMIELAQAKKIKVILAGMQIPLNYGAEYREGFRKIFPELARQYKVALIPFLLEGVGGEKDLNLSDGIHPNEKGHKIIAEVVFKTLKEHL